MAPQKPVPIPTPLPLPLPADLRATLQSRIVTSNAVPSILTSLLSACAASGWEDALRARVMEILREGEAESKEELLGKIVAEARGMAGVEGKGRNGKAATDIRVPEEGIREGTRIVRRVLEGCVEVRPEEREKDFWA